MGKRLIDMTIWDKDFFRGFSDTEKLLYLCCITSEKTGQSGIVSISQIARELCWENQTVLENAIGCYPKIVVDGLNGLLIVSKYYNFHCTKKASGGELIEKMAISAFNDCYKVLESPLVDVLRISNAKFSSFYEARKSGIKDSDEVDMEREEIKKESAKWISDRYGKTIHRIAIEASK